MSKAVSEVPTARENEITEGVIEKIKKRASWLKSINYVYVINKRGNLVGVASLRDVLSRPKTKIKDVMTTKLVTARPCDDQEKVADLAVKHSIKAIPIVENKKLLGVVTNDSILHILNKALREDMLHLAGIHKAHLKYENTLEAPLLLSVLHRAPWLVVGLAGITAAAAFISIFEQTLQNYLILAFFVPAIVYMSDALGTQHQTLFVRDLAVIGKELNIKKYFLRQMIIGFSLAALLAALIFAIISSFWNQLFMAFVIGTAMFITLVITSFTSLATTLVISKLNLDPALGSGPLATIISDVTSIIMYFGTAFVMLGGV